MISIRPVRSTDSVARSLNKPSISPLPFKDSAVCAHNNDDRLHRSYVTLVVRAPIWRVGIFPLLSDYHRSGKYSV
jgi:hypothetical protein